MLDADHPITESREDRLNRTPFAKALARCLLDHTQPESLVVGLYGGWGVGKTSVINLTLEELTRASLNLLETEKPIIINFSAWSYSGHPHLIARFFRRLAYGLAAAETLSQQEKIIYLLESYASFFEHDAIQKNIPITQTKLPWYYRLPLLAKRKPFAWETGEDITHIKSELNTLLHRQQHKIIIIMDNISRLYPTEIKSIFQIVKSMANYSNTIYLLAFDKPQVIHAMNELDQGSGEAFIEKMIQLPFNVPPILEQDLENILSDRLSPVMAKVPKEAWDSEYWADLYNDAIKFFFRHCRDITRYVNILDFSYSRVRDVVNPVDFFALTAVEVFLPEIYYAIRDNKDLFTDLMDNVYQLTADETAKEKRRVEEILSRTTDDKRPLLLNLLIALFPRLRHIYEPDQPFYYSDQVADNLKRMASPNWFDAYFRLSMQIGQLPDSEFNTILSLASDSFAFEQMLNRLNQDHCIIKFLNQLDNRRVLNTIPNEHCQTIISALLDNGDLFPAGSSSELSLDTPTRIHRIIHALLNHFTEADERFLLLQNGIANATNSIYMSIHELLAQSREHQEESLAFLPIHFRDITSEQLLSLQNLVATRIEAWANNQSLDEHPHLISILAAWLAWGNPTDCRHYAYTLTQSDRGLLSFLTQILNNAINETMTHYIKQPSSENYIDEINTFIHPQTLIAHAKLLFEDPFFEKLSEREQLALMIFLDIMKVETTKIIPQTTGSS